MRRDVLLGVSGPGWWVCQVLAGGRVRSWLVHVSGPGWWESGPGCWVCQVLAGISSIVLEDIAH